MYNLDADNISPLVSDIIKRGDRNFGISIPKSTLCGWNPDCDYINTPVDHHVWTLSFTYARSALEAANKTADELSKEELDALVAAAISKAHWSVKQSIAATAVGNRKPKYEFYPLFGKLMFAFFCALFEALRSSGERQERVVAEAANLMVRNVRFYSTSLTGDIYEGARRIRSFTHVFGHRERYISHSCGGGIFVLVVYDNSIKRTRTIEYNLRTGQRRWI